ncbi:hypothetical protein [Winogradskyella alexanderae]|uniref:Uncharacterized protein n=1 Tax=Winogradskyella alexanderae TaxID=2877123 RepID=A0ABS7XR72_9FLAO|nr:hypothetical protein [Winogradskyella alexanderae]MCA0131999.1 hypothetical protein [Winogradskyella alexanderae]
MRISGGKSIFDYDTFINNYKNRFRRNKETGISNTIELRFFERINNDDSAS